MDLERLRSHLADSPFLYDIFKDADENSEYAAAKDLLELKEEPTVKERSGTKGGDLNTLCTLSPGEPVRIVERQEDWVDLRCAYYEGWAHKDQLVPMSEAQAVSFAFPSDFAVVTEPFLHIDGITLDMGTKLPLTDESDGFYKVLAPQKSLLLPKQSAHRGYLPYSADALIGCARKWIGTPYKWGNKSDGVDCSGLTHRLFRCFGAMLPRDVDGQDCVPGENYISLKGTEESVRRVKAPALLFTGHHVMLLVKNKEQPIILHAPGIGRTVSEEPLSGEYLQVLTFALEL